MLSSSSSARSFASSFSRQLGESIGRPRTARRQRHAVEKRAALFDSGAPFLHAFLRHEVIDGREVRALVVALRSRLANERLRALRDGIDLANPERFTTRFEPARSRARRGSNGLPLLRGLTMHADRELHAITRSLERAPDRRRERREESLEIALVTRDRSKAKRKKRRHAARDTADRPIVGAQRL